MEKLQKAYNKEVSQTSVYYMDLETMFPDPAVRALAAAAAKGKLAEVDRLIADGVDVNAQGRSRGTPLFWAMANLEGFKRLLEHGADPNVIFVLGTSVVHTAAKFEDPSFLIAALSHGGDPNLVGGFRDQTPLFDACGSGPLAVATLLDAGADPDVVDDQGYTAAMSAASRNFKRRWGSTKSVL